MSFNPRSSSGIRKASDGASLALTKVVHSSSSRQASVVSGRTNASISSGLSCTVSGFSTHETSSGSAAAAASITLLLVDARHSITFGMASGRHGPTAAGACVASVVSALRHSTRGRHTLEPMPS